MKKKWTFLPILLLAVCLVCKMNPVQAEVTDYVKYRQVDEETGKNITSHLFILDDGKKLAVCIQRSKITPGIGSQTGKWVELFNEDLRKVLYYGYGGPEDKGYSVVETSCAAAAANNDNETKLGEKILEEIRLLDSPPPNFRVWKVASNGGFTQDLAFYTTLQTGELNLEKTSTDESCLYSLEGAVYGVFSDKACTEKVGELVTGLDGKSETISLDEGIYYVKELQAPEGYMLNQEILEVDVLVERLATLMVSDEPIPPYVNLTVKKVNVIGEVLEGAEFAIYEDEACSQLIECGRTDAEGKMIFHNLIKDKTYYLKETKAPDGYMLLNEIHAVVADEMEIPIVNEKIFVLPNTGSGQGIMLSFFGVWCVIKSVKKEK